MARHWYTACARWGTWILAPTLAGRRARRAALQRPQRRRCTPTQAGAALTEEDPHRLRRRAATSARLYLLDILQLQRNPAAVVLHRQLQAARSEEQIAAAIAEALQALPQITSASYTERVRTRIGELLPQALQAA